MEGIKACDLPNFEIEMDKQSGEYARVICAETGVIVIDLFGFRTVS